MNKEIDLSKYELRTDIALEQVLDKEDSVLIESYECDSIIVDKIELTDSNQHLFNKKKGYYVTLSNLDVTTSKHLEKIEKVFIKELRKLIDLYNIEESDNILLVGLGNRNSTPDSLGPKIIDDILVTRHLYLLNELSSGYQNTSAISFGVTGATGIETAQAIKAIVNEVNPKLIIVLDALASSHINNLNKTIQMTTAGIHPGSGVGNSRKELSKDTLGVDVIAIGVPTVVDSLTIISSSFEYMYKYLAYTLTKPSKQKMALPNTINYLKEETSELKKEEKENFLGLLGSLSDDDLKKFIQEVIEPIGLNMMVTPKEVDFTIEKLSDLISRGINHTLHRHEIF